MTCTLFMFYAASEIWFWTRVLQKAFNMMAGLLSAPLQREHTGF